MQVIVYENGEEGLAVVTPTPDALRFFSIDEIAEKDVPEGLEYWIKPADVKQAKGGLGKAKGKGAAHSTFTPEDLLAAMLRSAT